VQGFIDLFDECQEIWCTVTLFDKVEKERDILI
jgi:hypothetical protein